MHTRTPSCWCQVRHSRRRAASVVLLLRELRRHSRCAQYSTVVYSTVQYANCARRCRCARRCSAVSAQWAQRTVRQSSDARTHASPQAHLHTRTYARTRRHAHPCTQTSARARTHAQAHMHSAHWAVLERGRAAAPTPTAAAPTPPPAPAPPSTAPSSASPSASPAGSGTRAPSKQAYACFCTLPYAPHRVSTQSALRAGGWVTNIRLACCVSRTGPRARCTHGASFLQEDTHGCGGRRSVHG
jgi:hypothetical protein